MSFELWRWRAGTLSADDVVLAAALGLDGSVVLAGYTEGGWGTTASGYEDFAAVKLDGQGDIIWKWQENASRDSRVTSAMMCEDGSVVIGGNSNGKWASEMDRYETAIAAAKIASNGTVLWRFQANIDEVDTHTSAGVLGPDDSFVLAGYVRESAYGTHRDFAAIKVDRDGNLLWTWQEGTDEDDRFNAVAMGDDGSVVLAGYSCGNWSAWGGRTSRYHPAAAKLDADGALLWKWQDESWFRWEHSEVIAVLVADNDSAVLIMNDISVVKLDAGGSVLWERDLGANSRTAEAAAMANDGTIVIVGSQDANPIALKVDANGSVEWMWEEEKFGEENAFHAVATGPGGRALLAGASRPLAAPNAWEEDFWTVLVNLSASPPPSPPTRSPSVISPDVWDSQPTYSSPILRKILVPRWEVVGVIIGLAFLLELVILFNRWSRR